MAFACVLGTLATAGAPLARADQPTESRDRSDLEKARSDFAQALALEKEGDWAGALVALERVAAVKRTPQIEYHLALCLKNVGKPLDALRGFRRALESAKAEPPGAADEVLQNAPDQMRELSPLLGHLSLVVKGHGRFRIRLDGPVVPLSELGAPIPVEPGRHEVAIEVTRADGRTDTQRKSVDVAAGETTKVELSFEVARPKEPSGAPVDDGAPRPSDAPPAENKPEAVRWPSYLAFGVGGGFTVLTGVFLALRQDAIDKVTRSCTDPEARTGCDPGERETAERGLAFQGAAIGFGVATLAAVGTGVGLWIALTPDEAGPVSTSVRVGPASATLRTTF